MIANVLNIKVDRIESEEGPALGGAMLAAVACGVFSSVEEAAEKIVRVTETIEPEPELVEKYERQYQKFAKDLSDRKRSVYRAAVIKKVRNKMKKKWNMGKHLTGMQQTRRRLKSFTTP